MTMGSAPFGSVPFGGLPSAPAGQDGLQLQISPINVTDILRVNTYRLRQELNGRAELECELLSLTGYVPLIGQQVTLLLDGGFLFVGTVHEREVEFLSEKRSDYVSIKVRCVDLNELADRRIVVEVFENQTAGAIVRQILQKYLAEEVIQAGDIQPGPVVARVVFPYRSVAGCFDDLSEQTGFHWNIDQQRALNFTARTTAPAPFTITSANAVFRGLRGSRTRNQYRNVQYVDGGHGITDQRTESFRPDGTVQSWNVEFPIYAKPMIQLNFVTQLSVGIRGIDTNADWYWNKGETAIGHTGAILAATDFVSVSYQGLFDLIEIVEDTAAILERQLVQGGTGRYELLDRDDNLDGQNLVEDKGLSLLRRYGTMDDVADFETDLPGLAIGQLATLNVPELGLVGSFLITQLETQSLLPDTRRFRVTATTGEVKGTFQELFKGLLASQQPITIREGEILQEVLALHDPVAMTDSIDATLADFAIGEFGTGEVGSAEFGG
jgi:hypothetical protein